MDRSSVPPGLSQRFDSSVVDAEEGRQSSFITVRTREGQLVGGARLTIEPRFPSRHLEMPGGPMFLTGYEDGVRALLAKELAEQVLVVDSGLLHPAPGYPWHLEDFGLHRSGVPLETVIVDLSPAEDQLLRGVDHSVRQGIRKAKEHGLSVRELTDVGEIERIYPLIERFGHFRDFAPISRSRLLAIYRTFHPAGRTHILVCETPSALAGVSVLLLSNHRLELLVVASAPEFQKVQATSLMDWETFRFAKAHGATSLDFLGLPPAGGGLDGLRRFKLKWGGAVVAHEEYLEGVLYRVGANFIRHHPTLFQPFIMRRGPFLHGIR